MKIKRKISKASPEISTASMPDIVFILLCFFMVTTVIKVKTNNHIEIPKVRYVNENDSKDHIAIYVNNSSNVILNQKTISFENLNTELSGIVTTLEPEQLEKMEIDLYVDKNTKMKSLFEVKKTLRLLNLLKVNYIAGQDG